MRRKILLLGIVIFALNGCIKDDSAEKQANETKKLDEYLIANNINTDPTETGLYYIERVSGNSIKPEVDDYVLVNYTGRFLNNDLFTTTVDSIAKENNIYDSLKVYGYQNLKISTLISGFYQGLRTMGEGGKATLIIPSDLAYGYLGSGNIPPYTTLIYDVHLVKVIKDIQQYQQEKLDEYLDTIAFYSEIDEGLYMITDKPGNGDSVLLYDQVKLNYESYLIDGRKYNYNSYIFNLGFDNTIPGKMGIYSITEGWIKGILKMQVGQTARIVVHSDKAYGGYGNGYVSAYSPIVYKVEVLEINPKK